MQVPDRFQQVPTPEMWIPYKASSIFIQVPHRFQKVPTGHCKQALTRQLGLVNCWCGRWELGLGLELGLRAGAALVAWMPELGVAG